MAHKLRHGDKKSIDIKSTSLNLSMEYTPELDAKIREHLGMEPL